MKKSTLVPALVAVFAIGIFAYATDQQPTSSNEGPFVGKVVIINPSSIAKPRENVRVKTLADKSFLVYEVKLENEDPYEAWYSLEDVSQVRVFENMEQANRYLERQRRR